MLISTSGEYYLHAGGPPYPTYHPLSSTPSHLLHQSSAGELNSDELERIVTIIQNPTQFKIPTWFLNRQKDIVDGKNYQILSNGVDSKLRDDLERLKKIRESNNGGLFDVSRCAFSLPSRPRNLTPCYLSTSKPAVDLLIDLSDESNVSAPVQIQ